MLFPLCGFIWFIMEWAFDGEYTQELGGLIGMFVLLVFTIIYIVIFGVYDNNWSDINFDWIKFNIKLQ